MKGSWQLEWTKERVSLKNSTTDKKWTYELVEAPYCLDCGRTLVRGLYCWDKIRHENLRLAEKTFQMGRYYPIAKVEEYQPLSDILSQHILGLKDDHEFAIPIGESMAMTLLNTYREMLDAELMVPIPSYGTENNHAKALCDVISTHIQKVLGQMILVQTGLTKTTSTKLHRLSSGSERGEEVNAMFTSNSALSVSGKSVILIDDLLTRGDAKDRCLRILKLNGAKKIWVYVAAGT